MSASSCSFSRVFFFILFLIFPILSFAWNPMGHMVVASIAYSQLTPKAKSEVDKLIKTFHNEYPEINQFEESAAWLDAIKAQKINLYSRWHYIDTGVSLDGVPMTNQIDTDNAIWAFQQLQTALANKNGNQFERARCLAMLAHIVGDLHQPLHTITGFSSSHPNGDRGGNDFLMKFHGKQTNLHSVWDSALGRFDNNANAETARALAKQMIALYPDNAMSDDLQPTDWASEGMDRAKNVAYNTRENAEVSSAYETEGSVSAQQAAALAGYRLAHILNNLLK